MRRITLMICSYDQCIDKYGSDYQIKKRVSAGELFKLIPGFYSDSKHVSELELVTLRYPKAIFTMNSAFYYHSLTDAIPQKFFLATDKDASKISNPQIVQVFVPEGILKLGVKEMNYEGTVINVYSKERMLIEAVRNKNKMPYDYYKEIIGNYRGIIDELDIQAIQEYAEVFPRSRVITERLKSEVF